MGYYTNFEVEMDKDEDLVREYVNNISPRKECLVAAFNGCGDDMKWYECDEDVLEVSRQFPEVLITVKGDGESSRDFWKTYFKNGKMQHCQGRVVYDEFDEKELR
ncbi:MAG: hypothetical protein ACQEUO_07410 [Bacillota bacterium]